MKVCMILFSFLALNGTSAFAETAPTTSPKEKPCHEIVTACKNAGFVQGAAKEGNGLWKDCVEPIVQGTPQPKKAKKPLPSVDAGVVSACKQAHPHFGTSKKAEAVHAQ